VSGYSDPAQAVRLTSLAHQFIAKPCDGRELENIIERCFNLQDLLNQEPLRRVVGGVGKLPAMPKTYGRLQAALSQPSVTAAEVGDIVNADAAIAGKVLQITNSAFFRLRKPMVRIKDAVTYLGFATIRNLVLSAEIFSQWNSPLSSRRRRASRWRADGPLRMTPGSRDCCTTSAIGFSSKNARRNSAGRWNCREAASFHCSSARE
jgi:hypothetical protein